jgi:hypothetical protein
MPSPLNVDLLETRREASIAIRGNKNAEDKRKCVGEPPRLKLKLRWPR